MQSIFRKDLFSNKIALITGGGTGIGFRTARELASLGATVILCGRTMSKLEEATAIINKNEKQQKAFAYECNIREEDSVKECVTKAVSDLKKIDFLINNAGGQFPSPAEFISSKGWHAVIETNLTGTYLISKEVFLQSMKKYGGSIVNIIANMWNGFPMMSHTGAARAGVNNLTKTLAVEWASYGVRINAIAPGMIHTEGWKNYPPQFMEAIMAAKKNNLTYRFGTAEEVAASIIFLLSPAAAFITGETIKVDGGESIYSPIMPPLEHDKIPEFKDEPEFVVNQEKL